MHTFVYLENSTNYSAMRTLGMKIAKRLDINFFDIQNVSCENCSYKNCQLIYYD